MVSVHRCVCLSGMKSLGIPFVPQDHREMGEMLLESSLSPEITGNSSVFRNSAALLERGCCNLWEACGFNFIFIQRNPGKPDNDVITLIGVERQRAGDGETTLYQESKLILRCPCVSVPLALESTLQLSIFSASKGQRVSLSLTVPSWIHFLLYLHVLN